MTISRINYTGRKRIPLEFVSLKAECICASDFKLNVNLARIAEFKLPPYASVSIHGYHRTKRMIFDCGMIEDIETPKSFTSDENFDDLHFIVKVTDVSKDHGKLLAESNSISAKSSNEKTETIKPTTILPILSADLDDQIYQVDFNGIRPILLINKKAGDKFSIAKSPFFQSLVYPSVFREILTRILLIDDFDDPDDDGTGWRAEWLKFCLTMPGISPNPKCSEDDSILTDWIEKVVSSFSKKQRFFDLFSNEWNKGIE